MNSFLCSNALDCMMRSCCFTNKKQQQLYQVVGDESSRTSSKALRIVSLSIVVDIAGCILFLHDHRNTQQQVIKIDNHSANGRVCVPVKTHCATFTTICDL